MHRVILFVCIVIALSISFVDCQKCLIKATKGSDTDWPMTAYIVDVSRGSEFVCAATLVSRRSLITAAHCFDGRPRNPKNYAIKFGETDGQEYPVSFLTQHYKYKQGTTYYDIAVVSLRSPGAPEFAVPICLPKSNEDYDQRLAYVLEWTPGESGATSPQRLASRRALVSTNDVCNGYYTSGASAKARNGIEANQMCTDMRAQQLSCNSFSASPMILPDQHFNWFLVGISSGRENCNGQDFPGVYTRINEHLQWINTRIFK